MARKQVPFRLDPEINKLFEDAVDECGTTKQHVLEVFVESYVKHHREGALIHMNGVPCPLNASLVAMAKVLIAEVRQRALKL